MPDHTWRPTSAVVNADVGDVGDALSDGDTVHVLTRTTDESLYYVRLSFDAATRDYRAAPGVLVTSRRSSTPATIAKDSGGALWVGYANATNVIVTHSEDGGATWGRTVTIATATGAGTPEVGALVAYDNRVGMLWSDQATGSFRFASHLAGDDPTIWTQEVAASGTAEADNHISLRRIPGESLGRIPMGAGTGDMVAAVVKTSDGDLVGDPVAGRIQLLLRNPDGQWSSSLVADVADGLNDPVLQVDLATRTLHVFATHADSIITKVSPIDPVRFPAGIGEVFVNGTGQQLSDPTVTKAPVDARSGLVVLASDSHSFTYRHAELALDPATPVADPADVTPPTAVSVLRARVLSPESVVLSWEASTDGDRWFAGRTGVPVEGYIVSRDGAEVATVTSTSIEDRARAAGEAAASVEYSVTAVDASGNRSAPTTLVVQLPGTQQPRALVLGAIVLLGIAALIIVWHLLDRRAIARAEQSPPTPDPVFEEA